MKKLKEKLKNLIDLNEIELDSEQIEKYSIYLESLLEINQKINLISRKDEDLVIENHLIPCLKFSTLFKGFDQNALDIGTGGGFPGLVFAIYNLNSRITLIDSTKKKIESVKTIVQNLGLDNVELIWTRAEDKIFQEKYEKSFELIISRATAELPLLIKYSKNILKNSNSILAVMKGGEKLDLEIEQSKKLFKEISIKKVPLVYLPMNENNINKKYVLIVGNVNGIK